MLASESEEDAPSSTDSEITAQVKDKFKTSAKRSEQVQILTILSKSWSVRKTEKEFGASNYMVRKVKQLVKAKEIPSTPNPKPGKIIKDDTVNVVPEFYDGDEISRRMSGKKDFASIKNMEKGFANKSSYFYAT
jgi:hypothetical protein